MLRLPKSEQSTLSPTASPGPGPSPSPSPRFVEQQQQAETHAMSSDEVAKQYYESHYMPPWWLSPEAAKSVPPPDWVEREMPAIRHPPKGVDPVYNPNDNILLETKDRVTTSAMLSHMHSPYGQPKTAAKRGAGAARGVGTASSSYLDFPHYLYQQYFPDYSGTS